jgi:hypothetical protein
MSGSSLYRVLIFHVPYLISVFLSLGRLSKESAELRGLVTFRNNYFLLRRVVSPTPNHQAGGPTRVGCPRLLIQYIRSYPPYLEAPPPSATRGRAMPW